MRRALFVLGLVAVSYAVTLVCDAMPGGGRFGDRFLLSVLLVAIAALLGAMLAQRTD